MLRRELKMGYDGVVCDYFEEDGGSEVEEINLVVVLFLGGCTSSPSLQHEYPKTKPPLQLPRQKSQSLIAVHFRVHAR